MRAALWLLGLFGVAVAAALFAGNNQGTVTLYWPPYRIDLSLNMVVLLLVGGFVTVHAALRALGPRIATAVPGVDNDQRALGAALFGLEAGGGLSALLAQSAAFGGFGEFGEGVGVGAGTGVPIVTAAVTATI